MVREVSLARYTWEHLKPLSPNVEAINAERHLPSQFLLAPSRFDPLRRDSGMASGPSSGPSSPPPFGLSAFPQGRTNAPRAEPWVDGPPVLGNQRTSETPPPRTLRPAAGEPPFSADSVGGFEPLSKTTTFTHTSSSSSAASEPSRPLLRQISHGPSGNRDSPPRKRKLGTLQTPAPCLQQLWRLRSWKRST